MFISLSVLEPADDVVSTSEEVAAPTASVAGSESTQSPSTTVTATTNSAAVTTEAEAEEVTTTTEAATTTETQTTATTAVATTAPTTAAPGTVRSTTVVRVFNDAGFAGVAGLATRIVSEAGFETVEPTDAPDPDQSRSQILYRAGFEGLANEVATLLNAEGAEIALLTAGNQPIDDVSGVDIVVVVARDEALPR